MIDGRKHGVRISPREHHGKRKEGAASLQIHLTTGSVKRAALVESVVMVAISHCINGNVVR